MQLNERLGQFIGMVENDRLLNPDTRVARCLSSLYHAHLYPSLEKIVHISKEKLGLLSGASRQRANQALQLLKKQGLLSLDYGGICILDLEVYGVMRLSELFFVKVMPIISANSPNSCMKAWSCRVAQTLLPAVLHFLYPYPAARSAADYSRKTLSHCRINSGLPI